MPLKWVLSWDDCSVVAAFKYSSYLVDDGGEVGIGQNGGISKRPGMRCVALHDTVTVGVEPEWEIIQVHQGPHPVPLRFLP